LEGGQRNERFKWDNLFHDVHAIVFVGALSQYNELCYEKNDANKLLDCLNALEDLGKKEKLKSIPIYLFLNKQDILIQELKKDQLFDSIPKVPKSLKEIKIPENRMERYPAWDSRAVEPPSWVDIYAFGKEYKIQDLSEDVLCHIFTFLKYFEVVNISNLNSSIRNAANSDVIWKYFCQLHDPYVSISKVKSNSKDLILFQCGRVIL
jgi:hypothetical protein